VANQPRGAGHEAAGEYRAGVYARGAGLAHIRV